MVNYNKLPPGQYIQRGSQLKAITASMLSNGEFHFDGTNASPEKLSESVSWVFTALRKRRDQMRQIAKVTSWRRNEDEVDPQFDWLPTSELGRVDWAKQIHGRAIYRKLPTRGNGLVLAWQDPASMKPDKKSYNAALRRYDNWYRTTTKGRVSVSADDLLIIQDKGMRELDPATFAGQAIRLAGQVMLSIDTTLDDFFDHNALPVTLVTVPPGTGEPTKQRLERWFGRVFSARRGRTNKTRAISSEVTVTTLSLAPDDLALSEITDREINAIFLALGVPVSERQTVNKAEAGTKDTAFARNMTAEAQDITAAISNDPAIAKSGYSIFVDESQMGYAQQARREASEAGQKLSDSLLDIIAAFNGAAFERDNAMAFATGLLGLDEELADQLIPTQRGQVFSLGVGGVMIGEAEQPPPEPSKAWQADMKALRTFIKNNKHNDRWFRSNELTDAEILAEITRLDPTWVKDNRMIAGVYP